MKGRESPLSRFSPEDRIKVLNLQVAGLETRLNDTVELLHIWKNHALAYKQILEIHGIDAARIDQKVMDDFLKDLSSQST